MKEIPAAGSVSRSGYRIDFWTVAVILITVISIVLTTYGLLEGITRILPHLFYLPVILLAYRHPKAGVALAVIIGALNIALFEIFMPTADELFLITIKSLVLVGVGVVTALLSAELINKKERYMGIFSTSRSGILLLNPETGEINEANSHFYSILDLRERDPGITNIKQIWRDSRAREAFFSRLDNEKPWRHLDEAHLSGSSGERDVIISAGKLSDTEAVLTISDITPLRTAEKEREEEREKAQNYLDVAAVILLVIRRDLTVAMINRKGSEVLGCPEDEILGKDWFMEFLPEPERGHVRKFFSDLITGKAEPVDYWLTPVLTTGDETRLIRWQMVILRNREGEVTEFLCSGEDITERTRYEEELRESLDEKEVLLKEVHHRVKNNLQVISSLLELQAAEYGEKSEVAVGLHESENRIRSMALVHEHLYRSENLTYIEAESYISDLASELISSYGHATEISLEIKAEKCSLDIDTAVPCGMIINEVISNSLKHAFNGREKGSIIITLREEDGICRLDMGDNGIGLPPESELMNKDTLGLTLIKTLVDQMDATLSISREGGTTYSIIFRSS